MLLDRTIHQLDIGRVPAQKARELGQLGYLQWLGALPGAASYEEQAWTALFRAAPFADASPAVAVFCDLLRQSIDAPLRPLALTLQAPSRRGGAAARRLSL